MNEIKKLMIGGLVLFVLFIFFIFGYLTYILTALIVVILSWLIGDIILYHARFR
jgi:hypothetical protein